MPLQRCMAETTSTEFAEWQKYLLIEANRTTRDQFYFAQIAEQVFRGIAKFPEKVELEDFLIKFKAPGEKPDAKKELSMTPEAIKARNLHSKNSWMAITHMGQTPPKKKGA